jgi:hypothetical protein
LSGARRAGQDRPTGAGATTGLRGTEQRDTPQAPSIAVPLDASRLSETPPKKNGPETGAESARKGKWTDGSETSPGRGAVPARGSTGSGLAVPHGCSVGPRGRAAGPCDCEPPERRPTPADEAQPQGPDRPGAQHSAASDERVELFAAHGVGGHIVPHGEDRCPRFVLWMKLVHRVRGPCFEYRAMIDEPTRKKNSSDGIALFPDR